MIARLFAWGIACVVISGFSATAYADPADCAKLSSLNLLALMGISGATYIGFKIPEKQST
jgi:hypothetical protein